LGTRELQEALGTGAFAYPPGASFGRKSVVVDEIPRSWM
jgi:hypothetical protein